MNEPGDSWLWPFVLSVENQASRHFTSCGKSPEMNLTSCVGECCEAVKNLEDLRIFLRILGFHMKESCNSGLPTTSLIGSPR